MTAFVLVGGGYVGGWIWEGVSARLWEAGEQAHPATLTGMGDRRHLAGPDTDLETHIEDLVQLIDHLGAPEVVLVGHCYGIYPVVGAADRRPERVRRIVYVDAPMPQDGASMLEQAREQMPDEATRARVLGLADRAEDGWRVPSPTEAEWRAWGNVAGMADDQVARLAALSGPQPLHTMDRPLRLTGGSKGIAVSGVLCTAGPGPGIADVASLVRGMAADDERRRALTDPRTGLFELATGHWPMFSVPGELADVLRRAAAGEGQRLPVG
ncbi:alpha/beta fold hydrolase [Streptomyces sp. TR06-5]|uniref:alpha/beta fold hydrolase n=1 Tax=unclassified Streptomyces TaxID=2593676 RepID=UPI0039A3853F